MKLYEMRDGNFSGLTAIGSRPVRLTARGNYKLGAVVRAFGWLYVCVERRGKGRKRRALFEPVTFGDPEGGHKEVP